ncbi:MAG: serine hydrolase [Flavobacteriales bacterium]
MRSTFLVGLLTVAFSTSAQTMYFPPLVGTAWDTLSPASLGWCQHRIDSLYDFLEQKNTKGFVVLKDGRIVLERYFGTFTQDSSWYWASAGKTLTGFLVGMAQEQGFLDINDPTSQYLGTGWTTCSPVQEAAITVRHQLTMSTGLDDGVQPDNDCTDPNCLVYLADPGARWAYHNAPYTLLRDVLQSATGLNENLWTYQQVGSRIGMSGLWLDLGWNNVFFSTPRAMARFGHLLLNQGVWASDTLLHDQAYFTAMTTTSQPLNESYGYLTWLNGQASFMVPGLQLQIPGSIVPNAPADMFMALGKNDQKIHVVPSEGLVVVRMGNSADSTSLVPIVFDNEMWAYINALSCGLSAGGTEGTASGTIVYPNPCAAHLTVRLPEAMRGAGVVECTDALGRIVATSSLSGEFTFATGAWLPGIYSVRITTASGTVVQQRIVKE